MTDPLLITGEAIVGAGLTGLGAWALHRPDAPLQWRELRVPAELRVEQVIGLLGHVAAGRGPVVFVVDARIQSIRFFLGASKTVMGGITAALSGIAPGVRLDDPGTRSAAAPVLGARAWWPGRLPLLRTDAPEMAVAGLLGTLSRLRADEHVRLVVRLSPVARASHPESPDRLTTIKLAGPLLRAEVLLSVAAQPTVRARQLSQAVVSSLRTLNGPRGRLRVRRLRTTRARRALDKATGSRSWWTVTPSTVLSPAELVPLLALPVGVPTIGGLSYGTAPLLMPALNLPTGTCKNIRTFAMSNWPGAKDRPLSQPVKGGLQHAVLIGGTGSGKSTEIGRLALQDIESGRGVLIVDCKGDLLDGEDGLLARIPEHRQRDVILLDPASGGPQPGLSLFPAGSDPDLSSDLVLGVLSKLFPDFGLRTSQYLRLGLLTLAHSGGTLPELPSLYSDPGFRARSLRGSNDPYLLASWQKFAALSSADQAVQIAPALTRLEALVGRPRLRVVLGQAQPRLHFGAALARGQIVLVRLPPGLLGVPATRLLAGLVMWQFFTAVEARAALSPSARKPYFAYFDEIAALDALPLGIEGLLERARGLGVGITLAPQSLGQLSPSLRSTLLANVGSVLAWRLAADEAKVVARELPGVSADQLGQLGPFECALKLSLGSGAVTPTMTGRTLPVSEPCSDPAAIRRVSGERYGATLDEVDAALTARLGLAPTQPQDQAGGSDEPNDEPPIGARRRTS